jgi:hypothetical protein
MVTLLLPIKDAAPARGVAITVGIIIAARIIAEQINTNG